MPRIPGIFHVTCVLILVFLGPYHAHIASEYHTTLNANLSTLLCEQISRAVHIVLGITPTRIYCSSTILISHRV